MGNVKLSLGFKDESPIIEKFGNVLEGGKGKKNENGGSAEGLERNAKCLTCMLFLIVIIGNFFFSFFC